MWKNEKKRKKWQKIEKNSEIFTCCEFFLVHTQKQTKGANLRIGAHQEKQARVFGNVADLAFDALNHLSVIFRHINSTVWHTNNCEASFQIGCKLLKKQQNKRQTKPKRNKNDGKPRYDRSTIKTTQITQRNEQYIVGVVVSKKTQQDLKNATPKT